MLTAACLSLSLAAAPPMTQVMDALGTLQPFVASPAAFRAPEHQKAISGALAALVRLEHPFVHLQRTSSENVALLFGREAVAAQRDFAAGRTEAARYRSQTLSHLCIGCHAREPTKDFADAEKVVASLKLPPLQQAQFYATTRQLDRALELWKTELARPVTLETELTEQLDALRLALRVLVPMKDEPRQVRALLAPQLRRKDLPDFVRAELAAWEKDAKAWEAERFVMGGRSVPQLLAKAKALVASSGAENHAAPQSMAFVKLLRAASYLDEVLRREPAGASRGEVLYLLGVAHASVVDLPLWELEWMYFEACIREAPHTPRAATCGARLKSRTYFTWSKARDVPAETWAALGDLMALTLPAAKP